MKAVSAAFSSVTLNRKEMSMPLSRRTLLKTVAAAIASFFLPRSLRAERTPGFWFLHTETGRSWPVTDPVGWILANSQQPILARASAGLRTLTPADDQRIVRLVTRRCKLNLIEIHPERVVIHHWTQQGQGDLRLSSRHTDWPRRACRSP